MLIFAPPRRTARRRGPSHRDASHAHLRCPAPRAAHRQVAVQLVIAAVQRAGFTTDELRRAVHNLNDMGHAAEYNSFELHGFDAGVLIIRNYLSDEQHNKLLEEMDSFEWDTRYLCTRRKKVLNKHARSNVVILDGISQEPEYEAGKGRIVDGDSLETFKSVKSLIVSDINEATETEKASDLICEGNRYDDLKKQGIGYHGDKERRKVIALSLGASTQMNWQWFQNSKPVGPTYKFTLNGGDIYIMSEKAVGYDWRLTKGGILTMRHAAGATKYISLKKYGIPDKKKRMIKIRKKKKFIKS